MKRTAIILISALCIHSHAFSQTFDKVPIPEQPECVQLDKTELHYPGERISMDRFYDLLDSLANGSGRSVNIWHIGGSHVQAGHFSYRLQENLTSMADSLKGERGFLFPYRIANTNSDKSFRTSVTGQWTSAMAARTHKDLNPRFGIMGIAARTSDPEATVGLGLNISADTLWQFNRLRVLGYASSPDAFPVVYCQADTLKPCFEEETESYIFDLPCESDSVVVGFHLPEGDDFTLTGLEPLSGRKGINYFCSGTNGASLITWLDKCPDLGRDLKLVNPDLAIFAIGINDSACKAVEFDVEKFKERYRRLIALIRKQSPDCAFLFITNNDSYRYIRRGMTYNWNGPTVEKAMFDLAEEYGGAVWDLYEIMGGKDSVLKWRDAGLCKKDKLHFTQEGYVLLGDLLFNAIVEDHNSRKQTL